jgi:hypothetical protein
VITFNDIVSSAGNEPVKGRLVRHHDTRRRPTIYGVFSHMVEGAWCWSATFILGWIRHRAAR